ncbi:YeeE/YedE family protein [Chromatiaceae bacterium AAb-1]|nr:YeeE/YedE family protein [Chromatiaceae bacterium AAb-1]
MENFTPISAIIGGGLIGLGALLLLAGSGRIAGISGITAGALFSKNDKSWRLAFVAGLLVAPFLFRLFIADFSFPVPELSWQLLLAGLLVGLGTGWGNGCTSGHGICGVSRCSVRSVIATLVFMLTGLLTASIMH